MKLNDSIAILTEAFHANKSVNWITGHKSKIPALMQYSLRDCEANGIIINTENGIALCKYENTGKHSFALPSIFNKLAFALKIVGVTRIKPILQREKYIHAQHPQKPYLYLMFIGINPSSQSSGNGTKLLNSVCAHASEKKLAIYLETSNPNNLEFYNKNGFECYHTWDSELTGFTTWFFRKQYS